MSSYRDYNETEFYDKLVSINISYRHYLYIKENIPNFSEWVRQKLDEEMESQKAGKSLIQRLVAFFRSQIVITYRDGYIYIALREPNGEKTVIAKYHKNEVIPDGGD